MGTPIDITGRRFGRLKAVVCLGTRDRNRIWDCVCDCGRHVQLPVKRLTGDRTRSCGCLKRDVLASRARTHGLSTDPATGKRRRVYNTWKKMKQRCYNPREPKYPDYGARGITVCPEWREDFAAFHAWALANGYRADLTIERIDNDGNYEPSNCTWIPLAAQAKNRRPRRWQKRPNPLPTEVS